MLDEGVNGNIIYKATVKVAARAHFNGLVVDGLVGNNTWKTLLFLPNYPTLRLGSRGVYVKYLQSKLTAKLYPLGAVDGIFGANTLSAVRAFQQENNLAVDGIVGPNTWQVVSTIGGGRN